jgi:hypothetical protein
MADDVIIVQPIIPSITVTPIIPNVTITAPGPQGPVGPASSFVVSNVSYTHTQSSPASVWSISHNLGFNPVPVVLDSAGTQCEGTLTYLTLNTMTITFSSAFAGYAYII